MKILILLTASMLACAAADTGSLKTEVNPGRAGVFVDGKYLGPAENFRIAETYQISPGEHEVRLVDPRYEPIVTKVTITAGKKTVLKQTMKEIELPKPPFGKLRTENADHFAAVYVNGQYMGHVDEFSNPFQTLSLVPGNYEVKIVPVNGQNPVTKTVSIEADKTVLVK
jgi:hypothetical protein